MTGLPAGTVTFLFTDIERSTETVATLGNESYADALDDHRRALREAFAQYHGHEVGTEGDAFFVAFARAHEAVQAAVEGQKALCDHVLRIRMGIHTGEALVRGEDYVGHDVHKAKRICDAGHGGQILISQTTADLIEGTTSLLDLGPHRLKDLEEPQRLFQIAHAELRSDFPPLRSLESFRHNLPLQRSAFVGRDDDIAQVRKLIENERLVTLTGVGGCGKTRLALQVGAELLEFCPDGVFFIDLAKVTDPNALPATTSQAIGIASGATIGLSSTGSPEEVMMSFLRSHTCLLIFDNCEHLLDESAELIDRILASCASVTILATSREPLDVEGEQAWRVPSMSVSSSGDDAQTSEAVSLFKARARAVRPEFELTPANIDAVAEICRRLDGIPLAIEFAAARVGHLSPQQIAERLGDRFHLLTGSRRRVQRQQTLQAALDWSYDLLNDDERALLRRLAVFAGPFALAAAEGVCADELLPRNRITDVLGSLVAKSLVGTESADDALRFRLLETVRLYAEDHLVRAEESHATRRRHRDWCLEWIESFSWEAVYAATELANVVEAELPNLRAALEWSAAEEEYSEVGRIAARMFPVWYWNMKPTEGMRWLEIALASADEPSEVIVPWLASLCGCALISSNNLSEAIRIADLAVETAGGKNSPAALFVRIWRALFSAVVAQFANNRDAESDIRAEFDAIVEDGREFSHSWQGISLAMKGLGELCLNTPDRSIEPFEAALRLIDRDWSIEFWIATACNLSAAALVTGDLDRAVLNAMIAIEHPQSHRWLTQLRVVSGVALGHVGETDRARDIVREGVTESVRLPVPGWLEETMAGVAAYAVGAGEFEKASALLSWVKTRTFDLGNPTRTTIGYTFYRYAVREVRRNLDADASAQAQSRGRTMSEEEAIATALELVAEPD